MGGTENSLRHRMRNGRICVLHSGKAYDVTEFSDRHPGGKEWLVKNAGQDITQTMQNISPHKHTKTAYTILEKYRIHDSDEASKQQVRRELFPFRDVFLMCRLLSVQYCL